MIEIYKRNSVPLQAILADSTEQPIDITGYTVKLVLKKDNDIANNDSHALVNRSYVVQDGVTGLFDYSLYSEDTDITAGLYKFEVQLSKDNNIITVFQSKVKILETYIYE